MNTFQSILLCKCPRCHKGNLFEDQNPFNFKKLSDMPIRCISCGQLFSLEPGFYQGAMYVNYGFTILLTILNALIFMYFLDFNSDTFIYINISSVFVLFPFLFRYARVLYLYAFVRYDKEKAKL